MLSRFSEKDRGEAAPRFAARTVTTYTHKNIDNIRQDRERELRKRGDDERDCDSSDDDEEEDEAKSSSLSANPTKTKSKCSRLPPPPTRLPLQPPTTLLLGSPPTSSVVGVLPISVSAFPAMVTGVTAAATASTLSLNAPASTPPVLPSGTRKSGSDAQNVKVPGHHSLSPHAKTALIAFGVISKTSTIPYHII